MKADSPGYCVLLPCASQRWWVIPQRCLGEILTVVSSNDQPPEEVSWRGETVPVVDFGRQDTVPWRDQRGGTGLVAVVLGQRSEACKYFGVAVRGANLGVSGLVDEEIEDAPDALLDYSTAAFRMNDNIYQVPDLLAVQRAIGSGKALFSNHYQQCSAP